MRILIFGIDSFDDFSRVEFDVNNIREKNTVPTFIDFGGDGANSFGRRLHGRYESFLDSYDPNKITPMMTNPDACICYWDGKCEKTKRLLDGILSANSPACYIFGVKI